MTPRFLILAATALVLSACADSPWSRTYVPPAGYNNQDSTPISTPHGYHKTAREVSRMRSFQDINAAAWRDAAAAAIRPVVDALSLDTPISVIQRREDSPMEASAVYYISEALSQQDFLITPSSAASQTVEVSAEIDDDHPEMVDVKVRVLRGEQDITQNAVRVVIPHQTMEEGKE